MELYRPIGMDWFESGFWAINDQRDTAEQFLKISSQPLDNTPPLNDGQEFEIGQFTVQDPGGESTHRACTLSYFRDHKFDYVIASIPAHVPIFKELIRKYQPQAKLIVQMGNNWQGYDFGDLPVLASVKGPLQNAGRAIFYHQEFDLDIFHSSPVPTQPINKNVFSFTNIIQNAAIAWDYYSRLKEILEPQGWNFRAYGGQCPDGNMTGPRELADKMREAMFIYHVKPGGDGFGHIIHNAYAIGRPIITMKSHYAGQLAEELMVPGTFINLDDYGVGETKNILTRLYHDPQKLVEMGARAAARFREVVDYNKESEEIKQWLNSLVSSY